MPSPVLLRLIIRILEKKGFFFVSQKGSHAKYHNQIHPIRTVIVPIHGKDVPYRTYRSILRQSGISEDDFKED